MAEGSEHRKGTLEGNSFCLFVFWGEEDSPNKMKKLNLKVHCVTFWLCRFLINTKIPQTNQRYANMTYIYYTNVIL